MTVWTQRFAALSLILSSTTFWGVGLGQVEPSDATPNEASLSRAPIIDMHLHAAGAAQWVRAPNPVTGELAPETAEQHMRECLAIMERYNIIGVVDGPLEVLEAWRAEAPGRVIASLALNRPGLGSFDAPLPRLDVLREMYRDGRLRAMGEVGAQYEGLSASDMAYEPYFALAEELGIPVGIHTGTSFPQTALRRPNFRVALGNPILLEDLLVRHPRLRVYIMHGGEPWTRETVLMMHQFPQLYMDVAVINWIGGPQGLPRFHEFLRQMLAEGFGERILFGTDQMLWPEAIELAIDAIQTADFLSNEQKRDILYNNAARFLRLSDEEIARHHQMSTRARP